MMVWELQRDQTKTMLNDTKNTLQIESIIVWDFQSEIKVNFVGIIIYAVYCIDPIVNASPKLRYDSIIATYNIQCSQLHFNIFF